MVKRRSRNTSLKEMAQETTNASKAGPGDKANSAARSEQSTKKRPLSALTEDYVSEESSSDESSNDERDNDDSDSSTDSISTKYRKWRESAGEMYEQVSEATLNWPSLFVTWEPSKTAAGSRVLAGEFHGANEGSESDDSNNSDDSESSGLSNVVLVDPRPLADTNEASIVASVGLAKEETNWARFCPHNASVFASTDASGAVTVCRVETSKKTSIKPVAVGRKHEANGSALAWDPRSSESGKTYLITGDEDGLLVHWCFNLETNVLSACAELKLDSGVNCVAFNPRSGSNDTFDFAASCENGDVHLGKTGGSKSKFQHRDMKKIRAHEEPVHSVAFSPFAPHMLATASVDKTVKIFDTRATADKPQHVLVGHDGTVDVVKFSPHIDGVLASCSFSDVRIIIWDLSKIGTEQDPEDAGEAGPELVFMHGGHSTGPYDFDWHPEEPWLICSVDNSNVIQVWKPKPEIFSPPSPPLPNPKLLMSP